MGKVEEFKERAKLVKAHVNTRKALLGVTAGLGSIGVLLSKSITNTHSLMKVSGDLGITVKTASTHFAGVTEALKESTSEFGALGLAMSAQRLGIDGNNKNLLGLMNQEKLLTGGNEKVLATMVKLRQTIGLSDEGISKMSKIIQDTSDEGLVSTDTLLEALDGLTEVLTSAKLIGQGEVMTKAMLGLTQQFPGMTESFKTVMGTLMDGSEEGFRNIINAGALQERNIITTSNNSIEVQNAVLSAVSKFADTAKAFSANTESSYDKLRTAELVTKRLLGQNIGVIVALNDAIRGKSRQEIETSQKNAIAMKTLSAAWGNFMGVLQGGLIPFATSMLESIRVFLSELGPGLKEFLNNLGIIFKGLILPVILFLGKGIAGLASLVAGFVEIVATSTTAFKVIVGVMLLAFAPWTTILVGIGAALTWLLGLAAPESGDASTTTNKNTYATATEVRKLRRLKEEEMRVTRRTAHSLGDVHSALLLGFSQRFRGEEGKEANRLLSTLIEVSETIKKNTRMGVGK
tara:strand:- start:1933 stop:3489 length:1557 start_codon:yes stop_codon:yes gene_type:complete